MKSKRRHHPHKITERARDEGLETHGAVRCTEITLTAGRAGAILLSRMENQTTNIDLSALDTAAMRSRLSELGSYL